MLCKCPPESEDSVPMMLSHQLAPITGQKGASGRWKNADLRSLVASVRLPHDLKNQHPSAPEAAILLSDCLVGTCLVGSVVVGWINYFCRSHFVQLAINIFS